MSEHLLQHGSTRQTPQSQPVPGRTDQIVLHLRLGIDGEGSEVHWSFRRLAAAPGRG